MNYYIKCTAILSDASEKKIWLALVSDFSTHSCRVWFGNSVQVWSRVIKDEKHFVPISLICSRVVYIESEVDFGSAIGKENLLIILVD